jgi:2-polyprenyl-6-methoxyphenol hydroxylase-like FAD-dependent oxidoreductase
MLFHRQKLLSLLYDNLQEKEKRLLTNTKVVSIEKQDHGVTVHCSDGTSVNGSIVVGCDGVHSTVRHAMRDMMLEESANVKDNDTPMTAQYQLLAGHVDRIADMEPGRIWETRFDKMSLQCFMLEEEGWFLAYKRLDKPYNKSTRYTDEDAEAFANSILDCSVNSEKKFKDFWTVRRWFRLLDLEEGFIKTWHWDRMVLIGDSVHKMTPNLGLGLNQGWQGAAALTNILHKLLATNANPDTKTIEKAFAEYKATTEGMANNSMALSKSYTRITAWDNLFYKIADHIVPYIGGDTTVMKLIVSPVVRKGIVLDFVPEKGLVPGKIKWDNAAPQED